MRDSMLRAIRHVLAAATLLLLPAGCARVDRMTGEDADREIRATGLPAAATVLALWDTGVPVNDDPVVGFRLRVEGEGRPPWEAETRCLVRSADAASLGNTAEADLERWPATIVTLQRDYAAARVVVPGHGRPGGPELLARTLELLAAPR